MGMICVKSILFIAFNIFIISTSATNIDGNWGAWTNWSVPDKTCGSFVITIRTRVCDSPAPVDNGTDCEGISEQRKKVYLRPCPINGGWTFWSSWSLPSLTCGGIPTQTRTRYCIKPSPKFNGLPCQGNDTETQTLPAMPPCPINGNWSSWSPWGKLSISCGGNPTQTRVRNCTNPSPQFNGTSCEGSTAEDRILPIAVPCPINGSWSDWSKWFGPKYECGSPQEIARLRSCSNPAPSDGGLSCDGNSTEIILNANLTVPCPINGAWGDWGKWGKASLTCGGLPISKRSRSCNNPPPQFNGTNCVGQDSDVYNLPEAPPCPLETTWTEWSNWTLTSGSTCGPSPLITMRSRTCLHGNATSNVLAESTSCVGSDVEIIKIDVPECSELSPRLFSKIDGMWGMWSPWQQPNETCSNSILNATRYRNCDNPPPSEGGSICVGVNMESKQINLPLCKIDGKWTAWSRFSEISMTCGSRPIVRTRTRNCTHPAPSAGGSPCPGPAVQSFNFDIPRCDEIGWSDWNDWSIPTFTCGDGKAMRTRFRVCENQSKVFGGSDCVGNALEREFVDVPPCEKETGCPDQFTYNEDNGRCYYLITVPQNWVDTRNFCNGIHSSAHLVTPTTLQDFDDLTDFLNSVNFQVRSKCTERVNGTSLVWAGGQKAGDKFVWKPFGDADADPYFPYDSAAWIPGAPDNYLNLEDCVQLVNTDDGYRLNDIACSTTNNVNYNNKYKNFDKMCGLCQIDLAQIN